ncbi:MAG: hypothetical protein WBA16_11410 [Nonlabens sp.]
MIKKFITLALVAFFTIGLTSCREESESVGDKMEDVADDIEDSVD